MFLLLLMNLQAVKIAINGPAAEAASEQASIRPRGNLTGVEMKSWLIVLEKTIWDSS